MATLVPQLPVAIKERVDALQKHQTEYDNLKRDFLEELRQLERKFEPLYASVCATRRDIVVGTVDPAAHHVGAPKGIPGFWLTAMKNCRTIADFVEEHDYPVLEYLTDITTAYVGDLAGFRLDFHFAPGNPYFDNEVLSKVFHIRNFVEGAEEKPKEEGKVAEEEEEEDDEDGLDVQKIEGTEISWKAGKDVTVKVTKKKGKGGKGKGPAKTIVKEEPLPSFFRFFDTPDLEHGADATEEDEMEVFEQVDSEMRVGLAFREKLIPEAVKWFTGEIEDDEEEEDYDEEDEDEDEDDHDGEDEDEDEEDDDEPPKKNKGKGNVAGISAGLANAKIGEGGAAGGQPQPECKQQ